MFFLFARRFNSLPLPSLRFLFSVVLLFFALSLSFYIFFFLFLSLRLSFTHRKYPSHCCHSIYFLRLSPHPSFDPELKSADGDENGSCGHLPPDNAIENISSHWRATLKMERQNVNEQTSNWFSHLLIETRKNIRWESMKCAPSSQRFEGETISQTERKKKF